MSTLKTNNIEHLDANSPSIQVDAAGGMVVAGVITATSMDLTSSDGFTVGTGASVSSPATNVLTLGTNDTERVRIDSSGDVLVNHTSSLGSGSGKLQSYTNSSDSIDILAYSSTAANGGRLTFYRSKNNTIGNSSEVANGDSLGRIDWRGYNDDGAANNLGAIIEAVVSGDIDSTTDMPSDLLFKTSSNGTSSPTERMRITSGGEVQIANGNLKFSTSGTGIDFSATDDGSGTTDSELLDDYEEGTFTPALSATSVNVTYSAQQGNYTKIGRTVFFTIQLNVSVATSVGTGAFTIGGLPFSGSTGSFRYVIQTNNVNFDATRYSHYAYKPGATSLGVLYTNDNASWSIAQATDFVVDNGTAITITGFYKI